MEEKLVITGDFGKYRKKSWSLPEVLENTERGAGHYRRFWKKEKEELDITEHFGKKQDGRRRKMAAKNQNSTKTRIVEAAWKLFYEQGYEETTVEDILEESSTSRGSFYHYFEGKDALLGSLAFLFDQKYSELEPKLAECGSYMEQLLFLNRELFSMIENTIAIELLARLLSSQLSVRTEKHLMDRSRLYFRLLRKIILAAQESGEFRSDLSVNEMVKIYAIAERALMYDWCICNGEYSLRSYAQQTMPFFLCRFLNKQTEKRINKDKKSLDEKPL